MDAGHCTSCFPDSTLMENPDTEDGFFCVCDFPKVRLQSSFTCENKCSTGNDYDSVKRECSQDTLKGKVVVIEMN